MAVPVGLIISAVAAIAGSIIQSQTNKRVAAENTDRTITANKEQAEYAYSKELEMWKEKNKYNEPGAQMARLGSAGLNPNLVYGSGGVTGNTTGEFPKYNAPRADYGYKAGVDLPGMLQQYQNLSMNNAQLDKVEAQVQATRQKTLNDTVRTAGILADNTTKNFKNKELKELSKFWNVNALNQAETLQHKKFAAQTQSNILMDKKLQSKWNAISAQKKSEILSVEAEMASKGIFRGDRTVIRALLMNLESAGVNLRNWMDKQTQGLVNYSNF